MTEEQLEFFAAQTAHITRRHLRNWVRAALLGFAILASGVGYAIHDTASRSDKAGQAIVDSGRVVAVDGCNRDFRAQERFISLLERLSTAAQDSYKHGRSTEEQMRRAMSFYEAEIARAKAALPDCRDAEHVVTDDPNVPRPTMHPLRP
jgi:hypothetical protein